MLKAILLVLALVLLSNQSYLNMDGDNLVLTSYMPLEEIVRRLFTFNPMKIQDEKMIEPYYHPLQDNYISVAVTPAKKRNYFPRANGNPGKLTKKCKYSESPFFPMGFGV